MNRGRLLATLLFVAMLVLAGCGAPSNASGPNPTPAGGGAAGPSGTQAGTGAAGGPVSGTVTFWHAYNEVSPEGKMLTQTLIPEFEKQNPGVKVQSQSIASDQLRQKLLTSLAGGAGPDLVRSDIIWVPELAQAGALAPLDTLMPDFGQFKDAVYPGPLSTNYWNGHYYGLPLDTNTKVWFWNGTLYKDAGLQNAPKTTDDVTAQCQQFESKNPKGSNKYYYAEAGTGLWNMLPWIWSFGGNITDDKITKATGYLNSPQTVAAYDFFLKLYQNGCLAPRILGGGLDPADGFAADQYGSFIDGPWMYPIFQQQFKNHPLNAAAMPAGKGGSINVVGGEDIVVMQQSKNKAAALAFVRFTQSDEFQSKMASVAQMPVVTRLASSVSQSQPYFAPIFDALKTAKARPPTPSFTKIDQIMTDTGQAILRGQKPTQQALDDAAKQIDALLAQDNAKGSGAAGAGAAATPGK